VRAFRRTVWGSEHCAARSSAYDTRTHLLVCKIELATPKARAEGSRFDAPR
jgi:hypothetical protein